MHSEERGKLRERLLTFAAQVISIARTIRSDFVDFHISKQLVSCATSAGANYQEACGAESRADFIHKLQISLKELNESYYWLQLIARTSKSHSFDNLASIIQENKELSAIMARSILTAKERYTTRNVRR